MLVKYRNLSGCFAVNVRICTFPLMASIRVTTSFNIDLDFTAASFHRRLLAWCIDVLLLFCYWLAVRKILSEFYPRNFTADEVEEGNAMYMTLLIPVMLYHLLCELFMDGQSVGKKIASLRVVTDTGGRPSVSQLIIRWLIRTSDYMAVVIVLIFPVIASNPQLLWQVAAAFAVLVLDIILVNATEKHQRLGDILAHTMLIRTGEKANIADTVFLQVDDSYKPVFPDVMKLSDRDVNSVKSILDSARRQHDYDLAERAAEKIKTHLNISTSLSAYDFLDTLLKDYNYLSSH
jgi:uncharacterized RDD family membrane protein YckC